MPSTTELAPADPMTYLKDLQRLQREVEEDLRQRCDAVSELRDRLQSDYRAARERGRTSSTYEEWRQESLTQSAAAWVLACVFVRYLEDHDLVDEVWLAGQPAPAGEGGGAGPAPGGGGEDRYQRALDSHEAYFQRFPAHSDREYLQHVFRSVAGLPGCAALFGEDRNPLWQLGVSGDMARTLLAFFRQRDPQTGGLVRSFRTTAASAQEGAAGDTRFLGDLYQDLSENARKRYALLQTPDFVEEFILDRTLTPAIEEFGIEQVRLIDPACGSGHFLLGAFQRLFGLWRDREPGRNPREWARRAAEAVHGVDLNPFAAAIARFRLLVAYLGACGLRRLRDAPDVKLHVAAGDSLVYERRVDSQGRPYLDGLDWVPEPFLQGDYKDACEILKQRYHVVVGNPPYITDKDPEHRDFVRQHYASAAGKFSLGVPFTERFFELALEADHPARGAGAGRVGMITANSFMKREFGKSLIEEYLPRVDLTHVIDTSGAYIPGHGTPTVILFGRNRRPVAETVRAVLGVRGEPETPSDPGQGKVWASVLALLDRPGAENEFVTVADVPREIFGKHPWSLQGGGAGELLEAVEGAAERRLGEVADSIGITSVTGEDDFFVMPDKATIGRLCLEPYVKLLVTGDIVRDYVISEPAPTIWPYNGALELLPFGALGTAGRMLWTVSSIIRHRKRFGVPMLQRGAVWYEWQELYKDKLRTPLSIAFAFVATHNHFVLDRGGKVFNRTAPVIKLPPGATEDQHLALCGVLNSAVACFWLKQVCTGKHKGDGGSAHADPAYQRFEFDGTKLQKFPLPPNPAATLPLARLLDSLSREAQDLLPAALVARQVPTRAALEEARRQEEALFGRRVALQEELDWLCYRLYGLLGEVETPLADLDTLPEVLPGQRPFEIAVARKMAAGSSPPPGGPGGEPFVTTWFERHGSTPITEIPRHWPAAYRQVVERRLELMASDPFLRLLEKPEHKRRWNRDSWEKLEVEALRSWLLDRLETPRYWGEPELTSCARLADLAGRDPEFHQVASLYMGARAGHLGAGGREDYDRLALVQELVLSEAVPYLPVLRYKPSGLVKRKQWEEVWDLQRREDAASRQNSQAGGGSTSRSPQGEGAPTDPVASIPVPPKYTSADFQQATFWRLRGKLDVPKERFILYPGAEREADPTPVVAWAGWNHLQQAQALAGYYLRARDEGFPTERLVPLLSGLGQLLPWVRQWHPEIDPGMGLAMADFFQTFLAEQVRSLGLSEAEVRSWSPPGALGPGRRRKG